MNTSRPSTRRWRARTTASATRQRVSASAPGRSKAFSHSCFASFGKMATVCGPGVAGALYIGESISSSKAQAGMATKNTKRHNKKNRKERPREDRGRAISGRFSLAECLMRVPFFVPFCVLCGYFALSFWPVQLPRPHDQDHEQDHAGRTDDPPV